MYDRESYQKELKLTNPTSMTKEEKEALEAKEIKGEKDTYKGIINKILDSPKKYSLKDFPVKLDTTFRHPQEVVNLSEDFCLLHDERIDSFYLFPVEDYRLIIESYRFFDKLKETSLLSILRNLDTPNPYIDYYDKENMVKNIKKYIFLARCTVFLSVFSLLFGVISLPFYNSFAPELFFVGGVPLISVICFSKCEDKVMREIKKNIQYRGAYIVPSTVYDSDKE